jgi:hypothetical protein
MVKLMIGVNLVEELTILRGNWRLTLYIYLISIILHILVYNPIKMNRPSIVG